jgi:hypothetical protein
MSRTISGKEVSKVKVVDDNSDSREAMAITVNDAEFEALQEQGPLPDLPKFVAMTKSGADAVVCDHSMRGRYANFDGAEAVAELYKEKCPAILCTRWTTAAIDSIRQYIPFIPALLSIDDANPDTIVESIECCIREFNNDPITTRKPYKTLIRVESIERELRPALFFVAIPGWDSKEIVRLPLDLLPADKRELVKSGDRFFASINKGAERSESLFFRDFVFPEKR